MIFFASVCDCVNGLIDKIRLIGTYPCSVVYILVCCKVMLLKERLLCCVSISCSSLIWVVVISVIWVIVSAIVSWIRLVRSIGFGQSIQCSECSDAWHVIQLLLVITSNIGCEDERG